MKINLPYCIIISSIVMISLLSCSTKKNIKIQEENNEISLKWKISENDTLVYRTLMDKIGETEFNLNIDKFFGAFSKTTSDSTNIKNDSTSNGFGKLLKSGFFKEINDLNKNTELETFLTKSNKFDKIIDVEMIRKSKNRKDTTNKNKLFSKMLTGTQLKGTIYDSGSLHSFWLNNAQRNLISLFFELPKGKLKIGDTWSLQNLNYVQYGNIFHCDKAERKNEVRLIDIRNVGNDNIAFIEYDILENASGEIDFMSSRISSQMKMTYKARAEFSINKGKWISYNGFLSVESKGMMGSTSKQKFELIEK